MAIGRAGRLAGVSAPEPPAAYAACTSPGEEKIKAYKEAAAAAKASLDKMKAVSAAAKTDADGIANGLKKVAADEATAGQFEKVAELLEAGVAKSGRFGPLKQPSVDLARKQTALKKAFAPFKPCEDATDAPADVAEVVSDFQARQAEIEEQLKIPGALTAAVKSVPTKAQQFIDLVAAKAKAPAELGEELTPETLRRDLPKALSDLALAMRLRRLFGPLTVRLAKALDPAESPDLAGVIASKPDFSFTDANARLKAGLAKAQGWAKQAAAVAREEQTAAQKTLEMARLDPFHRSPEALAAATTAEDARTDFNKVMEALQLLLSEAQKDDFPSAVLPGGFVPTGAREISDATRSLRTLTAQLSQSVQQLNANITSDKSTWTMASVDLFYFDDVERLMMVLSPQVRRIGGREDLQTAAATQRRTLNEASQTLLNADAEVSDRRQEVADLQERVRLARARGTAATQTQRGELAGKSQRASALERRASSLTAQRQKLDSQKNVAQTRLTRAEEALEADAENALLQKRVETAQRELDRATLAADAAKAEEESATRDATAARTDAGTSSVDEEVEDLEAELTSARTALDTALAARRTATATQRTALREAFLAAQAENFAFAQARDNAPFLTNLPAPAATGAAGAAATPTPLDSDPISRVLLFAFPDTRTVFIRGQRDDIDLVRQIIKEFDEPHGQAVMTLRTMEISSDGTKKSGERALKFLKEVDETLNNAQAKVKERLSFLREAINEQAKAAVEKKKESLRASIAQFELNIAQRIAPFIPPGSAGIAPRVLAEQVCGGQGPQLSKAVNNEVQEQCNRREQLLVGLGKEEEELETTAFYDPKVLEALGWRDEFLYQPVDTAFLNAVIPPPTRSVNLAQALIALTLASNENRAAIVGKLKPTRAQAGDDDDDDDDDEQREPDPFASLRAFLGEKDPKSAAVTAADGKGAEILGFQSRLIGALRLNGISHVLEFAEAKVRLRLELLREQERLYPELKEVGDQLDELQREQSDIFLELGKLDAERRRKRAQSAEINERIRRLKGRLAEIDVARSELQTRADEIRAGGDIDLDKVERNLAVVTGDLTVILAWLLGNTQRIDPDFLRRRIEQAIQSSDSTAALLNQAVGLRRSTRFRFAQANESAVNLTFRKYLEQVNEDLTEAYIKPAFREINAKLLKEKLGVGVIQETSILASNRLVARVDPRGSAQLAVGQEQDVLEAARQLTNLFGIAGKALATGVTGNPLPLLAGGGGGAGSPSVLGTAQSVLSSLDQMPRGAAPTVYGIATGNLFQVTPVIDPSGQALRFRFDLVSATQIREPNDTIDPQLPRIERHSINTEVHLADQEVRLISQFQANSRLGIPKRRSGGFPILKDLPGVSEVPLIGWFVKRGGRAAQTQQSLIFCQTTMYPTLGEVLDVAVRSPTFTGLETPVAR